MSPRGVRQCCALLAFASPTAVIAQAAEAEPQRLDKVEIVGSHLKRVEQEGPTPISIYRRDEIEASGAMRLSDFLLALPIASAGSFDDRATGFGFHTGAAALSLRGLGPGATLVLLNGRRIAAYGLALDNDDTFVDLNSLPLAAVDRVEVLRDGASAIYGADAIGGVVNIVLRRDFAGAETTLRAGQSSRGDARRKYASATVGAGDLAKDGYNAFVTIDGLRQDATLFAAREFSRSADQRPRGGSDWRSARSFPPTVRLPDADPMAGPGCPPERVATSPFVRGSFCLFDPNSYVYLLPQVERSGALAVGSLAPAPALRLYGELAINRTRTDSQTAPSPVQTVVPAAAPTNPFGQDATVFWRPVDAGPRRAEVVIEFERAVAGAQGAWREWDWDVGGGTNRIRTEYALVNQLRSSAVLAALDAGTLNPFISTNDPTVLASVKTDALDRYEGRSSFVQAKASSELVQLSEGPLALAVGIESRRESFSTQLDPLTLAGDIAGTPGAGTADAAASRNVGAAFVEFNWPAAKGLEIQLAARYDRYSDFGSNTSPKVALRWQPAKAVLLRASVGRGFLPPSLQQLNKPRTDEFGVVDPVRCPVTMSIDDCGDGGLHSRQGNPELKAEHSRQHNLGIVLEPVTGWTASVDVWRVAHLDKIAFGGDTILANESAFPGRVVRAPPTAEDLALGLPGAIVEFRDTYINVASRDVRGADLELKGRLPAQPWGMVTLNAFVSYLERFVEHVTPQDPANNKAGFDALPRLRAQLGMSWQRAQWQLDINSRFIASYRYISSADDSERTVASWTAFDLSAGWRGSRDHVWFVMQNVGDRAPPFRDQFYGYDPLVHDPLGRFVSLSWRHSF